MTIKFADNTFQTFESGRIAIPIIKKSKMIYSFFPCEGLDENDEVPDWAKDFLPKDLLLRSSPTTFNMVQGVRTISFKKDNDDAIVSADQDIMDGSLIKIHNDIYEVLGWSVDCFNPSKKVIRFTQKFTKNANSAKYFICEPPIFKGNMQWLSENAFEMCSPVTIHLENINEQQYGKQVIRFRNACFNKLGFLTHDVSV